jgi:hypothetical protein
MVNLSVRYAVKVPKSANDEFEQKLDKARLLHQNKASNIGTKHLLKYAWNEEEFSVNHLPPMWENLYTKMLELIHNLKENKQLANVLNLEEQSSSDVAKQEIVIKLPEAMELSCKSTHLHKFDNIEAISEPKIIYLNRTWYK